MDFTLRITEIFHSLQGEGLASGLPTVFVRLTGCPLRCHYCDSEYAFHGGQKYDLDAIITEVDSYGAREVCVTGGEPLAQPNCLVLLERLCDCGYHVSLETSGAMSIEGVDPRVSVVLDLKTPDSGESTKNDYSNLARLSQGDQIKFVICSEADFQWARFKIDELSLLSGPAELLFSASFTQLKPEQLAQWIIDARLPVRMQLQMHKYLWGDVPGR
ncbi:7-carboxy-7-deazaguanine synthase QueE [Halioxenophilus aromaticivorans]|uniref:7-carboxy-7-deazaguanine synthase n=1 Tax=Halioxenophilus aromaticivorans TaxID=1306992 RepID=A0AAV3TWL5_9ALTE